VQTDVTEVTIYSDGAASPNPGAGGYGVILIRNGERRELAGGFRRTTNNRMELMGAIVGLRSLGNDRTCVTIHTDSKYVADMFTGGYAAAWRDHGWKRNRGKDPVLNPDLWGELLDLAVRHDVKFVWVRGHAENPENNRCDELAVAARQGSDLPADDGFEKPVVSASTQLSLFDVGGS
jgi:ribonuclease HI